MPKFDVVIGNPPYLKGAHLKFLKLAIDISEQYVIFVQPATWLLNEKPNQRKGYENILKNYLMEFQSELDIHNGRALFPNTAFGTYAVVSYINKKKDFDEIIVNDKINNKTFVYNNSYELSKYGNEKVYKDLKNKILGAKDNLDNHRKDKDLKNYVVNISQIRGHIGTDKDKIFDDDFYTFIPRDKTVDKKVTHDIYFTFNTEKEANNFIAYLKTKFARFALSIYKINSQLIKGELAAVPWLDFSENWTDEKLYKYFNLSKEEIDFIEDNIPNYY